APPEAGAVTQVVDRDVERLAAQLTGVEEHRAPDRIRDRRAQLARQLDQRAAAHRLVADEPPDAAPAVAADRVDAAGVEALLQRYLLRAPVGFLAAEPEAAGAEQPADEGLGAAAPPGHPGGADFAAEGLDRRARDEAAGRVEQVVGRVPVDAEPEAGDDGVLGRDARQLAAHGGLDARQDVVLGAVEGEARDGLRRLPLETGAQAAAGQRVGVLFDARLGEDETAAVVVSGPVRLQEVGGDGLLDGRGPPGEAELTRAPEEVVVAPAGEAPHLLLGVVAEAEADLVVRHLGDPYLHVDPVPVAGVLVETDAPEEAERDQVAARALEEALLERHAAGEPELAEHDRLVDALGAGDGDVAEDARGAAHHAVGERRAVGAAFAARRPGDPAGREAVLAVEGARVRAALDVALLREDVVARDREPIEERPTLGLGQLRPFEGDVDALDGRGRPLVDVHDDG